MMEEVIVTYDVHSEADISLTQGGDGGDGDSGIGGGGMSHASHGRKKKKNTNE